MKLCEPAEKFAVEPEIDYIIHGKMPFTAYHPFLEDKELIGDRYVVESCIERTNLSSVFKTHDTISDTNVAIKMFLEPHATARELVTNEIETHLGLRDVDHLVPALSAGKHQYKGLAYRYLVLAFSEAGSLADVADYRGPISEKGIREVAEVTADVACAIADMHDRGLVHRDIKPGNILIAPDNRGWLADLSVVTVSDDAQGNIVPDGLIFGTPAYMAPEALKGNHVSAKVDEYSLGATLHVLTTGRLPYPPLEADATNPQYIAPYSEEYEKLSDPREYNRDMPKDLSALITNLLHPEPEARNCAREMEAHLRAIARPAVSVLFN